MAQEPIVFNRTRPVEVPTSFTPGVFFIESNPESPGLELFVGGDFINEGINKATAKTYRKNGVEWIIDMDFGTLPTRGRYKKAQLGGGLEEDIVMVNNKGLKIFIGTDTGTYNDAFS